MTTENRDAAPVLLRDEALTWLLSRLEDEPHGTLRISVDHGLFRATYATGVTPCEGDALPNLTDALCSLIGCLS